MHDHFFGSFSHRFQRINFHSLFPEILRFFFSLFLMAPLEIQIEMCLLKNEALLKRTEYILPKFCNSTGLRYTG